LIKVILVRHGETGWNKAHRIQGAGSDIPLNETGLRQAEAVAARLKDDNIEAIYCSPLGRALNTARAIARYHQLDVSTLPSLREMEVGELEGVLSADLKLRFDEFICQQGDDPIKGKLPGGESICDVQNRAWDAVKGITGRHSEGTVVIVTHYFVIMSLVCRILNLPLSHIPYLRLSPGTITAFTIDGTNGARLELFNDGCHILEKGKPPSKFSNGQS
jgi:probable phosphoglycerate mutase